MYATPIGGKAGVFKSMLLASKEAASVDTLKDPLGHAINLNMVTAPMYAAGNRVGLLDDVLVSIMQHPIIRNLTNNSLDNKVPIHAAVAEEVNFVIFNLKESIESLLDDDIVKNKFDQFV